jgi:hypothetical protein
MSIRCYLKNDVCMVSDAPSLQPICKENRPYETLTLNFSVWWTTLPFVLILFAITQGIINECKLDMMQ